MYNRRENLLECRLSEIHVNSVLLKNLTFLCSRHHLFFNVIFLRFHVGEGAPTTRGQNMQLSLTSHYRFFTDMALIHEAFEYASKVRFPTVIGHTVQMQM